jgi:hypothetical protein
LWQRLAVWTCVLFILAAAVLVEASQEERPHAGTRVQFVGEVRLPQGSRFALIRDQETGHVGLYKRDESIHAGEYPLPLGKIVAVHDETLVLALLSGRTIEIRQGARLPGPRRLVFVRSALVDTVRYQVRFGGTATPSNFSVVDILDRRAILERDAIPGEGQTAETPGSEQTPSRTDTLVEMVNQIPLDEVGPDTWEVPAWAAKQVGGHLGPLVSEALGSARPSVTAGYGIAIRIDTSLGSGTLDRRGFKIGYAKLARRTGLEVGDRILFVNGQPVASAGGLFRIYRSLKTDSALSEVKVVINRNNQLQTLTYRIR